MVMVVDIIDIGIGRRCLWPYILTHKTHEKHRCLPVFFIFFAPNAHFDFFPLIIVHPYNKLKLNFNG